MKTVLKNRIFVLLSALVVLFCGVLGVKALTRDELHKAKANEVINPTLTIESNNVSYADSIYILYAVSNDGFDRANHEIKMLFWDELQEDYIIGTETYAVTSKQSATVKGKKCLIFYSDGLAAKEMSDDIFARAHVEINGEDYYSDVMKFSVLEYVHTMSEKGGLTTNQKNLHNSMLNYGTMAQYNFDHNTGRPANGTYHSVKVHGGKHGDGFNHGRYQKGDKVTIRPDEPEHGKKFWCWKDENGIIVSYDKEFEIVIGDKNKEYEAVYKDISNVATQLALTAEIPYDGTVNDIELPTAVSFEVGEETVVLEVTWNTENFKTQQIGTQSLYATLVDQSAYDRYNIARDGIVMNVKTMPYTFEIDQTTGEYILTGYYGADTEITLPTSYRNTFITTIKSKAFNQAKTLTKVDIPNTYKKIEQSAFFLCDNIEEITLPFTGENATTTSSSNCYFGWIFGATDYKTQHTVLPLALRAVNIFEGATKVRNYAFYNCENIENFNLPSTITSIGDAAFYGCDKLTEFTIPDNLTSLGSSVFSGSGLKRVNASSIDKVFAVGGSPFGSGADLYVKGKLVTEVTIPNGYTTINRALSHCTSVVKVIIPDGVTVIGAYAFNSCSNLTEIVIPDSVTSMGSYVFANCDSLTEIIIPDGVTSIGNETFKDCDSLTSVVIPDSVTSIGNYAFYGCNALTSVGIGDGVTSIGSYAFYCCVNLTEIVIPDGVTSIGANAFENCSSLMEIVIPDSVTSIGKSAFYRCFVLTSVVIGDGVTSIGDSAFQTCLKLAEITIPAYVYEIGSRAFDTCTNLAKVTILSQRLTNIGSNAFYKCSRLWEIYNLSPLAFTLGGTDFGGIAQNAKVIHTSLDETACVNITEDGFITYSNGEENLLYGYVGNGGDIVLPENVNGNNYSIYESTFYNYYKGYYDDIITSVVIPSGVTGIGDYAFQDCYSLTAIYYNATECTDFLRSNSAFTGAGKKGEGITVMIGANVKKIPAHLFDSNSNLKVKITSVVFEEGSVCESIGAYAFAGCDGLTSVVIPDSVTSIGEGAFYYCEGLTKIYYNATECADLTSNNYVFAYAGQNGEGITVTIGASVKKIPNNLFSPQDNNSLPKIICVIFEEGSVCESIGDRAFYYCDSLTEIIIPDSVISIGSHAFYSCDNLTEIVIPDSVTSIGSYAFYSCSSLTEIVIPDSVTSVGDWAFEYCSRLSSVVIGESVTSIGLYAFDGCTSLTEIYYNATECADFVEGNNMFRVTGSNEGIAVTIGVNVKKIPANAFANNYENVTLKIISVVFEEGSVCESIGERAFFRCSDLTSIVIPDGVTSIGNSAFYNCSSLTSVVLPSGVTSIGEHAFGYCSNLTSVYYDGTAEEWTNISISGYNDNLTNATRYYYSETAPTGEGNYWYYDENGDIVIW